MRCMIVTKAHPMTWPAIMPALPGNAEKPEAGQGIVQAGGAPTRRHSECSPAAPKGRALRRSELMWLVASIAPDVDGTRGLRDCY